MNKKKGHLISVLAISLFIGVHLFNHIYSIFGVDKHIELMTVYDSSIEILLLKQF